METLGEYINRIREEQDLSVRELAKRIGCSAPFLSDVIYGRRNPSDELLGEFARALDVPVAELRARDQRPPVDEIKRKSRTDPHLAMAFRTLIDKDISGKDLLELIEKSGLKPSSKKKE